MTDCNVVLMTQRSVAVVEWRESCLKKKYRLGHKGKVGETQMCRECSECGVMVDVCADIRWIYSVQWQLKEDTAIWTTYHC